MSLRLLLTSRVHLYEGCLWILTTDNDVLLSLRQPFATLGCRLLNYRSLTLYAISSGSQKHY